MSGINEKDPKAQIEASLAIFDKIKELTEDFFEKNPNANSVKITLKNPRTEQEKSITLHKEDSQT